MDQSVLNGIAPADTRILNRLTVGLPFLTDFIRDQYLLNYIPEGGSKIKFISGRAGSGKTHFANVLLQLSLDNNFLPVCFSAKQVWLHDFREIYLEILRQCRIGEILNGCAKSIISDMGYDPAAIPEGLSFIDYLSQNGEADAISKSALRTALRDMFTKNPMLDNSFAYCCSLLTGGILGYPILETQSRDLLLQYLHGDKSVKLSQLRALGISPSRVTKYNARHLLRSLSELAHIGGFAGIFVVIDDMEILLNRSSGDPIHYTKLRREDTYESLRSLIDEIDSMRYIMLMLSFDRELIDNDSYGIKSYQALWMRIQNEVVSTRFNRFADILDLDRFADEFYKIPQLLDMAGRLAAYLKEQGMDAHMPTPEEAQKLIEKAQYGGLGLPYLVNQYVIHGGDANHA